MKKTLVRICNNQCISFKRRGAFLLDCHFVILSFCQFLQLFTYTRHLHFVKGTCHFFSVSADERDGAPLFQKSSSTSNLPFTDACCLRYEFCKYCIHDAKVRKK